MPLHQALGVSLILVGCSAPVIIVGVFYYLKKRLEHRRIMAAIDKGVPPSQVAPAPGKWKCDWIRSYSLGVAMLVAAFGLMVAHGPGMAVVFIIMGIGAGLVIRGRLRRQYPAAADIAEGRKGPETPA